METGDTGGEEATEEERKEEEDEFPAPPSLGDLEELAREQEQVVPATPRTLRRADSLRQKMAARRIQRTWKHFYQELEEKKAHTADADLVEEEQEREDAISNIQVSIFNVHFKKKLKYPMLTQICAGSDNGPPRQSCQLGRSSRSRRNLHRKVQKLFNHKKVYRQELMCKTF